MPAAAAAASAVAQQVILSQDEKTGGRVEVAVLAVRHRFGMDGGNARVIGIVVHTCDARRLRHAQNFFVGGLATLGLRDAGLTHRLYAAGAWLLLDPKALDACLKEKT